MIHNGVDLSRFSAPREPGRIATRAWLPAHTPLVAVVSRLTRMKGLEQFIEAAAIVARQFPEARFLIVGETPLTMLLIWISSRASRGASTLPIG